MKDSRMEKEPAFPGAALAYDLAACLRFYSRIPVPALPGEGDPHLAPDFRTVPRMLPLAGLILALPATLVLLAGWVSSLGPFLSATLCVAMAVAVTGALHEDGLADVADGFGGTTRERRLEIMRDSRIGAYGGVALVLSLALRIGALATLLDRLGADAALGLLLVSAVSRSAALAPMVLLGPARTDGAGASVGRPTPATLATAAATVLVLSAIALALGLPGLGIVLMLVLGTLAALALTGLAQRRIGGQTGDVIGACQQAAEIASLLGLVLSVPA